MGFEVVDVQSEVEILAHERGRWVTCNLQGDW